MKTSIKTTALALALAAAIFTGTTAPAFAQTTDYMNDYQNEEITYDEYLSENWNTTPDLNDSFKAASRYGIVTGARHFLALRTEPTADDDNIIAELHNGNVVEILSERHDNYVYVYSSDCGSCGWVNSNYLR